jgi:hypothetical protein
MPPASDTSWLRNGHGNLFLEADPEAILERAASSPPAGTRQPRPAPTGRGLVVPVGASFPGATAVTHRPDAAAVTRPTTRRATYGKRRANTSGGPTATPDGWRHSWRPGPARRWLRWPSSPRRCSRSAGWGWHSETPPRPATAPTVTPPPPPRSNRSRRGSRRSPASGRPQSGQAIRPAARSASNCSTPTAHANIDQGSPAHDRKPPRSHPRAEGGVRVATATARQEPVQPGSRFRDHPE